MKHLVYFVGAGPGDPELITVKGKRLLEEADVIIFAGSLVPEKLVRLYAKPTAEVISSASLTLEEIHQLISNYQREGKKVVRLHSGDPSLYGAIHEQIVLLEKENIPYEVVPGVSAIFAASSKLARELTVPDISQTVILTRHGGKTPVPEKESLSSLATHEATMAIYLSIKSIEKVVEELLKGYPPDTPVVVAYKVSWEDERFITGTLEDIVEKVKKEGINRQALILVGKVFGERDPSKKSLLYDKNFEHGFRKKAL